MSQILTDCLSKIKVALPKGYQQKIADNVPDITISQVQMAFFGRMKDEVVLTKILKEANRLAKNKQLAEQKLAQETIEILNTAF
jgi:hypothetical protein